MSRTNNKSAFFPKNKQKNNKALKDKICARELKRL